MGRQDFQAWKYQPWVLSAYDGNAEWLPISVLLALNSRGDAWTRMGRSGVLNIDYAARCPAF